MVVGTREKPALGDHLSRKDIVAVYDAKKLIEKAGECAKGSLERVENLEKAVVKLNYAVAGAEERLRDNQSGAALILQDAKVLRSEAYQKLAEALREMGEGERDKYAKGWDAFRVREKAYGEIPEVPRPPRSPTSAVPAMGHGMYGTEGPASYHYAPSREDMARYDRELKKYGEERDEFFERLAETCEKKARG